MKKTAVIMLLLFCAGVSRAQVNMIVHLTNGDSLTYNVDSVVSLKFTPVAWPRYDRLDADHSGLPTVEPLTFYTYNIDSMTFSIDSSGYHNLTITLDTVNWLSGYTSFRVDGPYNIPWQKFDYLDNLTIGQYEIDTNVIQLSDDQSAVWIGNLIYCAAPQTGPNQFFELDSNLDTIGDVILGAPWFGSLCLNADSSGSYLLSKIWLNGYLQEYGIQTGSLEVIHAVDEESNPIDNVSNAVYYRGGDDTIIYYAYGSWSDTTPNPPNAGYYLFDRQSGKSRMLLRYISDLGPREMINGFDVSPDGKKLLLGSTSDFRAPLVIEYDLALHTFDTIPVVFDTATLNPALWVRYSHDGSKILYSNYPFNSFSLYDESYPSEVGIIDRATGSRRALKTNPTSEGYWDCILPQWSPDDTKIVYSAAPQVLEPPGIAGYTICILKTLR